MNEDDMNERLPMSASESVLGLLAAFGNEYRNLSREDRRRVTEDFTAAWTEDGCNAHEYRRRIGRGNLQSYADCLRVGEIRNARSDLQYEPSAVDGIVFPSAVHRERNRTQSTPDGTAETVNTRATNDEDERRTPGP